MNRYDRDENENEKLTLFKKTLLFFFVILYPFFVSIHTMLPPLIGLIGYSVIVNISKSNLFYVLIGMFYFLNLDLNLNLPIFLSVFLVIFISYFIYVPLKRLVRCRVCLLFIMMIAIDFLYYVSLFIYDFIFNTSTVVGDILLVYYIVVDIFIGVLL